MSQGLGRDWALENQAQLSRNLGTTIRGNNVGLPKYYKDLLGIDSEDLLAQKEEQLDRELEYWLRRFPIEDFVNEEDQAEAILAEIVSQRGQREKNIRKLAELKERVF